LGLFRRRGWDGDAVSQVHDEDAVIRAVVVGAKKTGIVELLDLLPKAPPDAVICDRCRGSRWSRLHPQFEPTFPCGACGARGWVRI
jgi:hypothetical protein